MFVVIKIVFCCNYATNDKLRFSYNNEINDDLMMGLLIAIVIYIYIYIDDLPM